MKAATGLKDRKSKDHEYPAKVNSAMIEIALNFAYLPYEKKKEFTFSLEYF